MKQWLQNIYQHPKTSFAGVLLGVTTIATALTAQGVTLGTAGKGTVVALIAGVATGLLGLVSKDPNA